VLVSGTLEPLASAAALALVLRLAVNGITSSIGVCATRLEEVDGMWTGRVVGEAMFGKAKARVLEKLAEETRLDLSQCYAYGDRANDQWLLAAVGKPAAVNPSRKLERIAREQGWPVLHWEEGKNRIDEFAPRSQSRADQEKLRHAERWI
jgi:phosphoserine phosphatase